MEFIDLKTQQKRIKALIDTKIQKVLTHGQYIMGPEVFELEKTLALYTGAKFVSANASGTDALLIALMSLEVGPGDEVITSPFTFYSSAEVISLLGATPVLADINPETYNIDPIEVEKKITKKTRAIMPVSLYGQCAQMEAINNIALAHNLTVIEDAAQSFGAQINGKRSCNLSTIACTSFFPSKPLGAYGDAGACFTSDEAILEKMNVIRIHGQAKRYYHTKIGINGRIDTLQAAILLAKMEIFEDEIASRIKVGERYTENLKDKFKTQKILPGYTSAYAQYTIEVGNREEFQKKLNEKGIPTAVHYPVPLHMQPFYENILPYKMGDFPHSEKASEGVVSLPMHPYLDPTTQDQVIEAVREFGKP